MPMKIMFPYATPPLTIPAEAEYKQVLTMRERLMGNLPDNDFSVELAYQDRQDATQRLLITPADAQTLRQAVSEVLNGGMDAEMEISIFPEGGGSPLGTISLAAIDAALRALA